MKLFRNSSLLCTTFYLLNYLVFNYFLNMQLLLLSPISSLEHFPQ